MTPFHKMHGLANDFVLFDFRETPVPLSPDQRRAIADRHRGVGCDQLILLEPSTTADLAMRIFNPDGEPASACGNAARCVGLLAGAAVTIETAGGAIAAEPVAGGVRVDMGLPRFDWDQVPLSRVMNTAALPMSWGPLSSPGAVNVGNPHAIFFVPDAAAVDLARWGPVIERDGVFPGRVNVSVAQVTDDGLTLRVWERGAGLTQACGTAACAAAVLAIRSGHCASPVRVTLPGGPLTVEWAEGGTIRMTGPAAHVFTGAIDLEALA